MFCPRCGSANNDGSSYCVSCGAELPRITGASSGAQADRLSRPSPPVTSAPAQLPSTLSAGPVASAAQVPSHMVWSILTTLFCCLPLGVVALVFSAQVGTKLSSGDVAGAMQASRTAATFCWISAGSGVVLLGLSIVGSLIS